MSSIRSSIDGGLGDRVGHARAALVEHDQPRERRQPAQEMGQPRLLPGHLHMRDEARHQDQVDRAVADHLVGDADRTALRVLRLRSGHADTVPRRSEWLNPDVTSEAPERLGGAVTSYTHPVRIFPPFRACPRPVSGPREAKRNDSPIDKGSESRQPSNECDLTRRNGTMPLRGGVRQNQRTSTCPGRTRHLAPRPAAAGRRSRAFRRPCGHTVEGTSLEEADCSSQARPPRSTLESGPAAREVHRDHHCHPLSTPRSRRAGTCTTASGSTTEDHAGAGHRGRDASPAGARATGRSSTTAASTAWS